MLLLGEFNLCINHQKIKLNSINLISPVRSTASEHLPVFSETNYSFNVYVCPFFYLIILFTLNERVNSL